MYFKASCEVKCQLGTFLAGLQVVVLFPLVGICIRSFTLTLFLVLGSIMKIK